jgi:site-specific DNA-methyltransferase (cytosine-N4-specific)
VPRKSVSPAGLAAPESRRSDHPLFDPQVCESDGEGRSSDGSDLGLVDWTFAGAATRTHTHGVHSYPAKFIPQIPRELISRLHPGDDSAVLDPFCGSGTTLVEAALAGKPAIGVDLSPLAVLMARVKTTPLSAPLKPVAMDVLSRARLAIHPVPPIPRLDHWFLQPVQRALGSLVAEIADVGDPIARDALRVALSSIIVRVSNQESDTRYAAIRKQVSDSDVFDLFERAAESLGEALADTWGHPHAPIPRVRVLHRDVLDVSPTDLGVRVSLVITSTPYPNAYEYWLYHKYRMYWLGMDPIAVREREIGARPHYFRRNPQTEHDFERQMQTCFQLLAGAIRPGGFACFLVGRSIIHGRRVDNEAILTRAAVHAGFVLRERHGRTIPTTRKAFNPSHSTISEEGLLVFELPR